MTQQTDNDRGHWPSASQSPYNRLCQGRHQAQQGILEGPQAPEAESGSAIHAALAGAPYRVLTDDEDETYRHLREKEAALLANWRTPGKEQTCLREQRLWHTWTPETQEFRCSGMADVIYIEPPRGLVLDYKTGRKAVTVEPSNLQLRTLAALLAVNGSKLCGQLLTEITVGLVQAWSSASPPCVYEPLDLTHAIVEMERLVESWYAPNAPRTPNPIACEYCRGKGTGRCPESTAAGLPVPFTTPPPSPQVVTQAIQTMAGERLGAFLALCRLAEDVATLEVRKRLENGIAVQGWALKPGRTTETVSDPQQLFNRFAALGGTTEQFLRAIKVVKRDLQEQVKEVTGFRGKALAGEMTALLEGITESKQSGMILERE